MSIYLEVPGVRVLVINGQIGSMGRVGACGDNADRVRSETAWARPLGAAPVPASSGMTTRHRLNRGGHRQTNSACSTGQ